VLRNFWPGALLAGCGIFVAICVLGLAVSNIDNKVPSASEVATTEQVSRYSAEALGASISDKMPREKNGRTHRKGRGSRISDKMSMERDEAVMIGEDANRKEWL
jgi:hypothetical protein